ncbi:MAG: hypothetical protein CMH50_02005, partial [Myxococcales bacterium]|nr:hypothetical protein [Myxococcales bacterium]
YQLADENSKELLKRVVEGIRPELAHQLVVLLFEELPHGSETGDVGFLLDDEGARALISNANVKIDRERNTRRLLRQWQVSDSPHAYRSGYIVEGLRTLQDLSFLEPHRSGDGSLQLKPYLEDDHFERAQPQAVRARFEEQFAELSLEQQHVLLCGSLCGEVFSVKNVAEGLHQSPLDVLQLLRSIEEDYGLVDDDDDDTTFRFVSAQFRRHLEHIKLKKEPGLDESVDGEGQQRSKVAKERPWRELAKQMHYNIATALQKSLEELKENATGPLREPDSATSSLIAYHAHQAGERLFGLASVHLAWGVIQAADRSAWSMAKRKAERFSRRQQWGFIESRDQTRNEWEKELHDRVWPSDLSGESKAELRFRLDLAIAQANSRHEGNRRILARALLRRLIQVIPSDRSQGMMHLRRRALILYLQISYAERQVSELEEIREDANQWLGGSQLTESETDVSMRSWFEGDAFANQVLRFFQIRSDAFLETRQCESSQRSERLEKSLESYAQLNFEVPEGRDALVGHERHQWLWCQAELLVAEAETEFKLGQRETPGDYNSKRFENFEAKLKSALECQTESGNLVDAARNHLSRANLLIEKMRCIDSAGSEPEDDDRVQVQERRLELDQCLDAVDELIRKTGAEKLRSRLENLHALIFWDKDLRLQAFDAAFKAFDAACETYTARDIFYAGGNLLRFANAPGEERPDGLLEKLEQRIVDQEEQEAKEAQKKREDRQTQDAARRNKRQGLFIMCEWSVWRELPDGDDLRQKFLCIEPLDGGGYQVNVAEPGYLSLENLDPNRPYARFCRRVLAAQIRAYRGRGGQKNRERIRYLSNYLVDNTLGKANVAVDEYIYDAIRANLSETYEEKQVDELLGVLNTTQVWRQFLIELKQPDAMSDLCSEVVKLYATLALNFLQRDDGITPARHLYGRLLTVGEDLFAQWRAKRWGTFSGKEAVAPQVKATNRRHRRLLSRVLREAVLILERLDGEQDDWMIQVRSWLQSAVDNQHVSAERFGELSELQAEGLRSGLLLYAETIARSGAAPVAVAQIEIQRADQKIWQLQKRLESTVDDRERSMNETRALIDDAYRAYERAGDVLERHRYESFRSKLRNTFANIDWRKAMAQSEQDKLGRSTELLAAYDRAQRAYEMASDWNRERDLVYAAITLLRFRLDYLSHQKLVKEADRQEFDQRWLHTVQRLQEDERLGDQEAAEDRLTLASPSIWGEVMSNGDQLGKKLKSQLGKLEKDDHVDTTWCQKIRSAVDKGSDLDAMIETSPGASEAMAFWDKELVYE